MKNQIEQILEKSSLTETTQATAARHSWGSKNQRKRLKEICELALNKHEGNILEIGAHIGLTTQIFCELARKYNRKMYVIDPWNGQQQGGKEQYKQFVKNTEEYNDVLIVTRESSQLESSRNLIKETTFAFCFVDGLHTKEACRYDIESCITQKGIIAVDDTTWSPGLIDLIPEFSGKYNRENVINGKIRESYII